MNVSESSSMLSPEPGVNGPRSNTDLFEDNVLIDPYPAYHELRELGGAVWMNRFDMFMLPRYFDVRKALEAPELYASGEGVMLNDDMNRVLKGIVICSDGPDHAQMRKVLLKPLGPRALRDLTDRITNEAEALVERLVAQGSFDAATDFAQHLPVTIVSDLVGLPKEGRERMLIWAAANFNCLGPMNKRTTDAFGTLQEMVNYARTECVPEKLKPGGWAQMLFEAADRGEIRPDQAPVLLHDYMGPSLDTTICATSSAMWLLASHPDQYKLLRENPALIPNAINEVLRIESPVQGFSRVLMEDCEVDGTLMPRGSRVYLGYSSANRDPRKWENPDQFDIRRRAGDHVAFGYGVHQCIGNNLARLEITALLSALIKRVERIELGQSRRMLNNLLRGFDQLEVSVY